MRIFKHYIPLSLLSLGICEAAIVFWSVYICGTFIMSHSLSAPESPDLIYPEALLAVFTTIMTFYVVNLYDLSLFARKSEMIVKMISCSVVITIITLSIVSVIPFFHRNFTFFLISNSISFLSILSLRSIYSFVLLNSCMYKEKVLILGYNSIVEKIIEELRYSNNPIYDIIGCIADVSDMKESVGLECSVLGSMKDLQRIVRETIPNAVVVALSERRGAFPAQEILDCKLQGIRVEDWPTFYEKLTGKILIQNLRPSWLIFVDGFARNRLTRLVKRAFDMVLALFGICISMPLMGCIVVLTKLDSSGPVIFKQERVGENGKIFTLCKFRTMVADAEQLSGPVWAQTVDPRVTRLGKILRRTGMDELPQLFNVLKGDMSFVGPRPERPFFVSELQQQIPYYTQRLVVKPGISGWAQVRYGYGATIEDTTEKLQYDLYYIKNMSFFLDVLIILSTIQKVLFARVAVQQEDLNSSRKSLLTSTEFGLDEHTVVTDKRFDIGDSLSMNHSIGAVKTGKQ